MAELVLSEVDRNLLADLMKDHRRPRGLKKGTWCRLITYRSVDVLEMQDLRALAFVEPRVLSVLGIPRLH